MSKKNQRRLTLAAVASLIAAGFALTVPAQAQINVPPAAGATAGGVVAVPSVMPRATSVEQALKAPKHTDVLIEGRIVNKLKHEHYTFQDASGKSIQIELDDKYLPTGVKIDEKTLVRISGVVDTHRMKPNDIDVKHIEIVK